MLLLCLTVWQTSAVVAMDTPRQVSAGVLSPSTIERTDDWPQWQDVGMCDVLAVTGGSTLTPPTSVRVVQDSPAGTVTTAQAAQSRCYSVKRLSAYCHHHLVDGYIYLIHCLRL